MVLKFLPLAFCLAAIVWQPAHAESCGTWTAAIQEDEGGPRMTASVCVGTGEQPLALSVTCFGDTLDMEYAPAAVKDFPPGGNEEFKAKLILAAGSRTIEKTSQYQAMNGVMELRWKRSDPLTQLLKSEGTLTVTDATKHLPPATFPLKAAKAAIERLEKTCGK
eukprot:gene28565-31897_t